jgi:hypothetical protein
MGTAASLCDKREFRKWLLNTIQNMVKIATFFFSFNAAWNQIILIYKFEGRSKNNSCEVVNFFFY